MREFFDRLQSYGPERLLKGLDLWVSFAILMLSIIVQYSVGVNLVNNKFVEFGTDISISLVVFILTGLALIVSFSDKKFLALLKDVGIYNNIMFIFQYTVYLAILSSITGGLVSSYKLYDAGFFIFLFIFMYTILSVMRMVGVIVAYGERKAKFDKANQKK